MFFSPHAQDVMCATSIFWILAVGVLFLIAFGGYRIFHRRGMLSSLLFVAGILVGLAIPVQEIASWIFYMGTRGQLPWVNLLIGLALVAASLLIPSQKKPDMGGEDQSQASNPD